MSLTLKIDRDEPNKQDMAEYLQYVVVEIMRGNIQGEDWEITGEEDEDDDDMPEEESDFTGATPDNGEGR